MNTETAKKHLAEITGDRAEDAYQIIDLLYSEFVADKEAAVQIERQATAIVSAQKQQKIEKLEAALAEKDKDMFEIDKQKYVIRLEKENESLRAKVEKLDDALRLLIGFLPDGWEMPLGWNQVVAQAQEALKEADHD